MIIPVHWISIKHAPNSFFDTGLADLGFSTTVLHDACTTKDLSWNKTSIPAQIVHRTIMASLQGTFAKVISADEFIKSNQ